MVSSNLFLCLTFHFTISFLSFFFCSGKCVWEMVKGLQIFNGTSKTKKLGKLLYNSVIGVNVIIFLSLRVNVKKV